MEFQRLYTGDPEAPIGCSLDLGRQWEPGIAVPDILGPRLIAAYELPDGFDLHLVRDHETEDRIRRFVSGESRCCPFFTFDLGEMESVTVLRITGPAEAKPIMLHAVCDHLRDA